MLGGASTQLDSLAQVHAGAGMDARTRLEAKGGYNLKPEPVP